MREQTRLFHYKMTTDSDSKCSYVANLADFNVIRVIIIVIVIKIIVIVIKIVYNSLRNIALWNAFNFTQGISAVACESGKGGAGHVTLIIRIIK